jgi:hypothetical protein
MARNKPSRNKPSRNKPRRRTAGRPAARPSAARRPAAKKSAPRLLVATRKGLFLLAARGAAKDRLGGGWSVARSAFVGEPVSMALHDPRDGTLYAALSLGHFGCKLHRSRDEGKTWEECAVPVYPAGATAAGRPAGPDAPPPPQEPASLELIWSLEPGGPDEPGVLWAGTIPGGLFRSPDRGSSWTLCAGLWNHPDRTKWMGGGYDHAGIHSVAVHPRKPGHLTVAVSSGGVWTSEDAGATWAPRTKGMRAAYVPPEQSEFPEFQDPHRLVQCPASPDHLWLQHHNGMFRSADGGRLWQELSAKPSTFGFAVAVHPQDADSAWFVPAVADQCRVPVSGRLVVNRTRDGGRTFTALQRGLPQRHAYDLVYRHGLAIDDSGTRLALGSTTGGLWSSADGGASWQTVSASLPPIFAVRFMS